MTDERPCTRCRGFESLETEGGLRIPCPCRTDEERWNSARIPARYFTVEPSTLPAEEIQTSRFLWGPPGHGKTMRAIAILKRWARRRFGGVFVYLPEHEKERRHAVETGVDVSESILSAPFLVADDLCRQPRITDFWREFLELHVGERYNKGLPTIWTSNLSLEQIEGVLGEHVAGRIAEMCAGRVEHVKSKNWRLASGAGTP